MNVALSTVPAFSTVCRSLLIAGASALLAASCNTAPEYGAPNVFVAGQPQSRFGYGSTQSGPPSQPGSASQPARERSSGSDSGTRKYPQPKIKNIKRDPSDTTLDLTPPEPAPDNKDKADTADSTDSAKTSNDGAAAPAAPEKSPEPETTKAKPAAPREDLPFGQPVVGKKGFVYSPYAPNKGQVDVQDIPSGTKVKCPYTEKTFRVP